MDENKLSNQNTIDNGPMFNAYPDSLGGTLSDIVSLLQKPEFKGVFSSFYILPSLFNTDLDRGFSVIDYRLDEVMASSTDLENLSKLDIKLKLDFILNHASVLSHQFQDIIKNGKNSKYVDFFINWNEFWSGNGELNDDGYIVPEKCLIENMFFRKEGLPILMVRFPDGSDVPYWNTFYQEVKYPILDVQDLVNELGVSYSIGLKIVDRINSQLDSNISAKDIKLEDEILSKYKDAAIELLESKRRYLGQMDLNIKSPLVWEFYEDTLKTLSSYGASIVRLDAFAYAPKEVGMKNFLNDPQTWELLAKVQGIADNYALNLLPEIHASYEEKIYEKIADSGYITYDFFLPGLIIDALESCDTTTLCKWANELIEKNIRTVNMLGCHDGIPLLDLKGIISDERIEEIINIVVSRGGLVKELHGKKNVYYQVNATYYSAIGEDDKKMLLSRALQIFMPGKPQVWYLDLFVGTNDYDGVKNAGAGGHKEINRTNLTIEQIENSLEKDVVQQQLKMLKFRNEFKAFDYNSNISVENNDDVISFVWEKDGYKAILNANLKEHSFVIIGLNALGETEFTMSIS